MTSASIFVFVLVLVAGACVVLAWIIFDLRRETQALASWRDTTTNALKGYSERLVAAERESPQSLGARVDELDEAVRRVRFTQQRFAGRFDQYVKPRLSIAEEVDGELQATLDLQNAK